MPCGYINMCFRGCIYGQILTSSIVFTIFGGAFAPPPHNVASPLPTNVPDKPLVLYPSLLAST
jgi:hypothetical protein